MTLVPLDPAQTPLAFAHASKPVADIRPSPFDLDTTWQPLPPKNASLNSWPSAVYAIL